MKNLLFILLMSYSSMSFSSEDLLCQEVLPLDHLMAINEKLSQSNNYYLYFEGETLEELQTIKNCIDYMKCGKSKNESIVDDPKNFRIHIWNSFTPKEFSNLLTNCPIPDLNKKLVIKDKGQQGKKVNLGFYQPSKEGQKKFLKDASPAFFEIHSKAKTKAVVEKIGKLLKEENTNEAHYLLLKTWGIDLHGYELVYTGKSGGYSVTNHSSRKIEYGKAWLSNTCDYIRMIRHEAEHVAQMKKSRECGHNHNLHDHKMRERAAHLNDARFLKEICPNAEGDKVKDFCLNRFRDNYFNK